jgi:hypothetical protein
MKKKFNEISSLIYRKLFFSGFEQSKIIINNLKYKLKNRKQFKINKINLIVEFYYKLKININQKWINQEIQIENEKNIKQIFELMGVSQSDTYKECLSKLEKKEQKKIIKYIEEKIKAF